VADEIKQKIVLEGEKEYSAALKDANSKLRALKAELKAETTELGINAAANEKNALKVKSLKQQIEQQEKVVNTLKAALGEVEKNYSNNSAEVEKWRTKLANARTTLANMKNDLDKTETELKESQTAFSGAGTEASNFGSSVKDAEKTANAVTFQSVNTAIDNLTTKMQNAAKLIAGIGKSAWEWMGDSGEWADTLATESTKWGVDPQTLQGWRYAARFVDTEVETIAAGFRKLTNRSDEVNGALGDLGIDVEQNTNEVFWDLVDALSQMDEQTANDTAQQFFGKSFQEMLPLIRAGREEWEKYVAEANESGYVLDDDQLSKLTKLDDANQKLEASFESMKLTLAEQLAPAFETIAKAMSDVVTSFTEWSKTEEGQKSLEGLRDAITGIVSGLTEGEGFKGLVDGAAGAVSTLTDALTWIKDNWDVVKIGIAGLGAAFGLLKVSSTVLSALQLIKQIPWGSLPKDVAGGGGGGGGGGGFLSKASGWMAKNASLFSAGGGWLTAGVAAGLAGMGIAGKAMIDANLNDENLNAVYGSNGLSGNVIDTMSAEAARKAAEYWSTYTAGGESAFDARDALYSQLESEGYVNTEQAVSLIESAFENALSGNDADGLVAQIMTQHPEIFGDNPPDDFYSTVMDALSWQDTGDEGLTSEDVSGFAALPEQIKQYAKSGIAEGAAGLSITMDGYAVGQVTAPYVSQILGSQIP